MYKPKMMVYVALVAALTTLLLSSSGCIVVRDSPAPGCVEYLGLRPMGGCFGKTALLDLAVSPQINCLDVTVNNCNGGVLEIHNGCAEALTFDGVEIAPGENVALDVAQNGEGYELVEASGNFSEYIPEKDECVEVSGRLDDRDVTITFTKTAPLCE